MTNIEELNSEQLEQPSVELVEDDIIEIDIIEMDKDIKVDQVVVIAKLSNGKYHQVLVTNTQVDTLIGAIDQICQGIKLSDQELAGVQFG